MGTDDDLDEVILLEGLGSSLLVGRDRREVLQDVVDGEGGREGGACGCKARAAQSAAAPEGQLVCGYEPRRRTIVCGRDRVALSIHGGHDGPTLPRSEGRPRIVIEVESERERDTYPWEFP